MHRPFANLLVMQSVVYFIPVYLFGILCSMECQRIYEKLADKEWLLLGGVLMLAILQAFVFNGAGNLSNPPFQLHSVDINLFQKMLLCLLFMVFFHRFEHTDNRLLNALAASSFAIFFLHCWVIQMIGLFLDKYSAHGGLHLLPLTTTLVAGASYMWALAIRSTLPRKSRLLIGW